MYVGWRENAIKPVLTMLCTYVYKMRFNCGDN